MAHDILEVKDPGAVLDYVIDWTAWLDELSKGTGDTITLNGASQIGVVSPVTVPPLVVESVQFSTTKARIWVSGGLVGTKYSITIEVTTAGDDPAPPVTRKNQRTLEIYCEER